MTKSRNINTPKKKWTENEVDYLKQHFSDNFSVDIATALKCSVSAVRAKAHLFGLKKTEAVRQRSSRMSGGKPNRAHFKAGHVSWNKGMGMPDTTRQKCRVAWFEAGRLPHNTKCDGARSKRSDGYWWIRVALRVWRQEHICVWEKHIGPVEKGMCVTFRDGNRDNLSIDNLVLISRHENMLRNSIHRYPDEIKDTIRALAKFKKQIKKHEERHAGGAQHADPRDAKTG